MPRKSIRKSVKRQRSRSRIGRNSVRRKSSSRTKRKSTIKTLASPPQRRRSRVARKSLSRRGSTRRGSTRRGSTRRRRKSTTVRSDPRPVSQPQPPQPPPRPRKSTKGRRRRNMNTGSITTFYCIECQADKNISNLRNLEYTHVSADSNKIRILATCGKCKNEVSRIVNPQQFEQLRKKKRIYEQLDARPNEMPSLKVDNPADLYSVPSTQELSRGGGGEGSDSGSESGSESDGGGNDQADMIRSQSSAANPPLQQQPSIDVSGQQPPPSDLKRMTSPPNLNDMMGDSAYKFKC